MKKLTKILFSLSLFVFLSCTSGVNIEVTNNSKLDLQKIVLKTAFSENNLGSLKINESKRIFLNFSKNKVKHDGIMRLLIYEDDIDMSKYYDFGYYSNGIPPEDIKVIIKDDIIFCK